MNEGDEIEIPDEVSEAYWDILVYWLERLPKLNEPDDDGLPEPLI